MTQETLLELLTIDKRRFSTTFCAKKRNCNIKNQNLIPSSLLGLKVSHTDCRDEFYSKLNKPEKIIL